MFASGTGPRARRGGSPPSGGAEQPWLDLEVARRRLVAADPRRAHNAILFRQPLTTLDDVLERGLRIEALGEIVEATAAAGPRDDDDEAFLDEADLAFGPPILRPPSFRDFYAFEQHVATMWQRRQSEIPEAWYRLPIFYFSNTSEIRGPGDPVWAPRGSTELDFELEVGAIVDTPAFNLPEERAGRGDRRLPGRQRLVRRAISSATSRRSGSGRRRARTSRRRSGRGS